MILMAALLLQMVAFAQTAEPAVEMADGLYQSGKIYVVITALAVIFIGIIIYLILLDRKIGKLEKELKKN
jgi:CcmD family protein